MSSKRPLPSGSAFLGAAVICLAALFSLPSVALAARPHEFTETIGTHCLAEPCTGAQLLAPTAVAVNEATGDIYVLDKGEPGAHGRVVRFSQGGVFQSEFDGSGTLAGEGTAAGGGVVPGEIPTGRFSFTGEPGELQTGAIAVDNSCSLRTPPLTGLACTEADPSSGDVYVADTGIGHQVIDKYTAAGGYLGQITEAGGVPFPGRALVGVAVDPKGTVSIYREEPAQVDQFTNAEPNVFIPPELSLQFLGFAAPGGFAVDTEGNFYGARGAGVGITRVTKWGPTGNALIEELGSGDPTGVAVEQTSDASVVDTGTRLTVFGPAGSELETLGEEGGAAHLQAGAGVGVNATAGFLYAADPTAGPVVVFGPAQPTAPKVEGQSFSEVGAHEAAVAAEINPSSETNEAPTEYHFEYGRCATATTCAVSGYEAIVPVPDGQIPAGFEVREVGVELTGLAPNTTYHFRAIARNGHGEGAPGAESNFTTQLEGGQLLLSDSRQWQLVSPPDKQGALIAPLSGIGVIQAAAGGDAIAYLANATTEAEPEGNSNQVQVLSRRGAGSWSSRDIAIPHSGATGKSGLVDGPEYKFFDSELTEGVVQPFGEFIPALSTEATESTAYLHDLGEGCGAFCYHPLVSASNVPAGTAFGEEELCRPIVGRSAFIVCGPEFLGATEDLSHVILTARGAALTPGSEAGALYEWSGGRLAPVSVLPGQQVAAGNSSLGLPTPGASSVATRGAISSDGDRIVWTRGEKSNATLYLRDMTRKETVQLDSGCPTCESGGGQFQYASSDGSRVFFTDLKPLTPGSGTSSGSGAAAGDLYECRIVLTGGELGCELTDLTPPRGGETAEVLGSLLGAGSDGSTIYFVAEGVLTEEPNNTRGQRAQPGKPNLYVRRGATTEFIATLSSEDSFDWAVLPYQQPTRVSSDGRYLAFMSQASPTGYDNRDRATGRPVAEVYLYDLATGKLSCASCEPTGARPVGIESDLIAPNAGGLANPTWPGSALVAANVPGWTGMTAGTPKARHQPRYLSDSGRLFFNTLDALVPQDSNGTEDVYEYEPPGIGSCTESTPTYSARSGGCVSLISSGSSREESAFLDASESGDDVFFLSSANLASQDIDASRDVYDAHACSAASPCLPEPAPPAAACEGTACQTATPAPTEPSLGTPSFTGPGNPLQCRKGQVKKAGKCVKKKPAKKHKKKNHKKSKKKGGKTAKGGGGK